MRISISSPPDRKKLVAEIFIEDQQLAELNQENAEELFLEIYPRKDGQPWNISYEELVSVLDEARRKLTSIF